MNSEDKLNEMNPETMRLMVEEFLRQEKVYIESIDSVVNRAWRTLAFVFAWFFFMVHAGAFQRMDSFMLPVTFAFIFVGLVFILPVAAGTVLLFSGPDPSEMFKAFWNKGTTPFLKEQCALVSERLELLARRNIGLSRSYWSGVLFLLMGIGAQAAWFMFAIIFEAR